VLTLKLKDENKVQWRKFSLPFSFCHIFNSWKYLGFFSATVPGKFFQKLLLILRLRYGNTTSIYAKRHCVRYDPHCGLIRYFHANIIWVSNIIYILLSLGQYLLSQHCHYDRLQKGHNFFAVLGQSFQFALCEHIRKPIPFFHAIYVEAGS
jgi:hypothetical protein